MPRSKTRRTVIYALITLSVFTVIGLIWLLVGSLLIGNQGDTSTDLVTPTIAANAEADAPSVRVFDVAADESQVDFVAIVRGIELQGVFPVRGGPITLEPVEDDLRVHVYLEIDVDHADTGNLLVDRTLRAAMGTGNYPLSFYVAQSREIVPVTSEPIAFVLDGDLEVHNVVNPHSMEVEAQLTGSDMWAIATSDLDLGQHGVEFPAIFGSTEITLTARLQSYEQLDLDTGYDSDGTAEPAAESSEESSEAASG